MANPGGAVSKLKELIAVARDGTADARADLLRDITDVFMTAPDRYTSTEMQHFDVILSKVTETVETSLRAELARRLADVPTAPRNLVRQLALDEFVVAEPILERSLALTEEDLVRVVRQRTQSHMKAISRRREVSEAVTSEIVDRGDAETLVALAENRGARFDAASMEKMVEHARAIGDLQAPLTQRYDLAPQLLTQMYFFVSSALKREILKRSDMLDPALIDEAIEGNRQRILKSAVEDVQTELAGARRYFEERLRAGAVNEQLLKELMDQRRGSEFLLCFAHVVGVDAATAQRILKDRTWESAALASRACGLDRSTFAKIVFGLQKNEEEQQKALRILDLYLKVPQEAAERVMRFWRVRSETAPEAVAAAAEPVKPKRGIHAIAERAAQMR